MKTGPSNHSSSVHLSIQKEHQIYQTNMVIGNNQDIHLSYYSDKQQTLKRVKTDKMEMDKLEVNIKLSLCSFSIVQKFSFTPV